MKSATKYPDRDAAAGPGPTPEVIAKLAELLWEKEGRPAGRDEEFRLQAEIAVSGMDEAPRHEIRS